MKNGFIRKLALVMTAAMLTVSLAACGNKTAEENTDTGTETSNTTGEEQSETGGGESGGADTLVVGYDYFSSKFSPFFHKTAFDQEATLMTSVELLTNDREGNIILNGIEGETIAYNGVDYTYTGMADCVVTQNDDGSVYYDFTIRDDINFSDGTPVTIDDVIFSLYVYSDPTYDGSATIYAVPILGMEEYRSGMETLSNLILQAGRDAEPHSSITKEQQDAYWAAIDKAGAMFAQDIVDYCVAADPDSLDDAGGSEVALGMMLWGFGEVSEDGTKITGKGTGTEYETASVTADDYWAEIFADYEGDIQAASDTETANTDLFTFLEEVLGDDAAIYNTGVNTGESVDHIEGIEKTGDYSMRITTTKFDAAAIYRFIVEIAPLHYYGSTELYDYDNNMFGFPKGDLGLIKDKTTKPMGAGPYIFKSFENGVITYEANKDYFKGAPKTANLLFRETSESDKLSGVVSGVFDIANPALSLEIIEAIKGYNSNQDLEGDVITTDLVDNRGYGYIGINADNVKVGNDKASEESKNLRAAFATLYAAHREAVVNSYYGEMASVIQYPISNTSWAAPKPADEGYAIAYSTDVDGNPIYTSDMTEEDKYKAALEAAVGFLKAAGYTYDEASGMFTDAPAGASMSYEVIIPADGHGNHPSFGILTAVKEAMAEIGITLEINDPADSNVLWTKVESGTAEMWVAAWQADIDPDMYQTYYSTNIVGAGGTDSNSYGVQDSKLDELIMNARTSADQSYRKATYKDALNIILDWAVEVPVYQRQNAIIFSPERVNMNSVAADITTYYEWWRAVENVEMN